MINFMLNSPVYLPRNIPRQISRAEHHDIFSPGNLAYVPKKSSIFNTAHILCNKIHQSSKFLTASCRIIFGIKAIAPKKRVQQFKYPKAIDLHYCRKEVTK